MTDLTVRAHTMEGAEMELVRAARRIHGDLDDLETQLNPLRSDWQGSSQAAYDAAKRMWDDTMREMVQVLEATAVAVRDSASAYRDTDVRSSGYFPGA